MSFVSSASGRACLSDWGKPLSVSDLLTLLADLKRTLAVAGSPVILIVVVREAVPVPANDMLACIRATLPAIRAHCEELVVAIEGTSAEHPLFRASFQSVGAGPGRHAPTHLFGTLSGALAHTQRLAPHDVLELQRHMLHRDLPVAGT
jgi:hypothetical protein